MLKKLLSVLSATLLAATVVSCSAGSETTGRSDIDEIGEVSASVTDPESDSSADIVLIMPVTEMTVGVYRDVVDEFNAEDNGYRIEFKYYDEYYDSTMDTENASTMESFAQIDNQIVLDFIKGEKIDIVPDNSFTDKGRFNELVKKGAFTDLNPFLVSDEEINRETLNDHILEVNETNGELMTIPLFYTIDTLYGETQYVGEKRDWTFDELAEHWNRMPERSTFNGRTTKTSVYEGVLRRNLASFVDIQNCKAYFDSPDFLKELEFINSFPQPIGQKTDPDNSVPEFISHAEIDSLGAYHSLSFDDYFNKRDITIVGYPSDDGGGSYLKTFFRFGISDKSTPEQQKGAWLFIKRFLSYDFQYELGSHYLPVNNAAFSDICKEYYSRSGESFTYTIEGQEYTGSYPDYDEYCEFLEYIDSVKKLDTDVNNDITKVIEEEICAMIFDGKSPEETASAIQNRVEILVSEIY